MLGVEDSNFTKDTNGLIDSTLNSKDSRTSKDSTLDSTDSNPLESNNSKNFRNETLLDFNINNSTNPKYKFKILKLPLKT